MKSKKLSTIYFLAALVFFSCDDDKDEMDNISASGNPVGIVENSHTSGQTVSADFRGRISNQQGAPIPGASVSAGGSVNFTNAQGFYQLEDALVDDNYALIKVEYNGMFDQYRALKPRTSQTNYVDIAMIQKVVNGFFSTSSGGVINVSGGPTVSFPAGELVTSGGQPYSGEVLVASTYLDPSDTRLMSYMPGSLAAVDDDGEAVGMITYGMVGVELTAVNGQKLQLAGGRKATLTIPLPETHSSTAPESIPLWYFDEAAGVWQEEGVATRSGDAYVGQVSHFSFWNCDISVNTITLEGEVSFQPLDFPFSDVRVKLTRPNGSSASSMIDSEGFFSGIVPADEILELEVLAYDCEAVFYSEQVGPYSVDTDLGEIMVEISALDFGIVSLSGTIVDCEGDPMENVFLAYEDPNAGVDGYLVTDEMGEYSVSIPCMSGGVLQFVPSSLTELVQGDIFTLSYDIDAATTYDLGQIALCDGVALVEYFNYSDGTNELQFDEVEFVPSPDGQQGCGDFTAFLDGSETTDYTLGIQLINFGSSEDTLDFWGACSVDIEIRGYLASGEYMIATIPAGETFFDVIQQIEDGTTTLLEATALFESPFTGNIQVDIFEDDMSTTPLNTYEPASVNVGFQVIYEE
jgi:hypothetical protein